MRGGWLVDPRTETVSKATILVRGGRIDRLIRGPGDPSAPAQSGVEVVDLDGLYV